MAEIINLSGNHTNPIHKTGILRPASRSNRLCNQPILKIMTFLQKHPGRSPRTLPGHGSPLPLATYDACHLTTRYCNTPLGVPGLAALFYSSHPFVLVKTILCRSDGMCSNTALSCRRIHLLSAGGCLHPGRLIYRFIFALLFTGTSATLWVIRRTTGTGGNPV